ncbi:mediator of RNA polymerase II transcription subunit 1-domain-containing protein [Gongronella butleri]|nr:mediator of RNA polymerase II transcription subunit 1-domain-containing protein [Gongronella butleri]
MTSPSESKTSINSSIFEVQNILHELQTHLPALSKPSESSTVAGNNIHAFGPVNLDKTRQEFKQQIDQLRSICSQFEADVGDMMGAGTDPTVKKHFNQLKEQAALQSSVLLIKQHWQQSASCLEKALNSRPAYSAQDRVEQLEKLATSMGLVSFIDTSQQDDRGQPLTTITLGGKVIVIDIDIQSTGHVQQAKVTFVPEHLQKDQDDKLDYLLTTNLQGASAEAFKQNLGTLAQLDHLNITHAPMDFFVTIRHLYQDLKTIAEQETLQLSNQLSQVLLEGHGIPCLNLNAPGIAITYWMDKEKRDKCNWDQVDTDINQGKSPLSLLVASSLTIGFEESTHPRQYLPADRTSFLVGFQETEESITSGSNQLKVIKEPKWPQFMPPLRFVKPSSATTNAPTLPVRFVAKLTNPLPASDIVCQKLLEMMGIASKKDGTPATMTLDRSPALSLEDLLVQPFLDDNKTPSPLHTKHLIWGKTMEGSLDQAYEWMANTGSSGKLLHRIPFQHPAQLFGIVQCLRQQHMFNDLFHTIFNQETYKASTVTPTSTKPASLDDILQATEQDQRLRIQVTSVEAPKQLQLSVCVPANARQAFLCIPLMIEIPADQASLPKVRLESPADIGKMWNPKVLHADDLTAVLQKELNVPSLVAWLWQCIQDAPQQPLMLDRPLKRAHNMMDMDGMEAKHLKLEEN